MANKKIPLKDKEIVKHRLATGASLEQAIKGTHIASIGTASNIAKSEANNIAELRARYLKVIEEKNGANLDDRGQLWAEMAHAMRPIGATILVDKDGNVKKAEDEGVIEVPDWFNRREALKYIDNLAGISNTLRDEGVNVNVGVVVNTDQKKYGF